MCFSFACSYVLFVDWAKQHRFCGLRNVFKKGGGQKDPQNHISFFSCNNKEKFEIKLMQQFISLTVFYIFSLIQFIILHEIVAIYLGKSITNSHICNPISSTITCLCKKDSEINHFNAELFHLKELKLY